jgi:hypothetical protein
MKWLADLVMPLFAGHVDEFATGAKWINQVFVGWSANMNWYCEIYMGCKAMSALKTTFMSPIPPGLGSAQLGNQQYASSPATGGAQSYVGDDMADLPLVDRLFSLDEPYSLLNQAIRSMPSDAGVPNIASSIFRQVGSLPATLLASVTGRARAATPTPQQIADITGVRQYGYGPEDLARDISPEIFSQAEPVCPEDIDQETQVNLCMADREVAKALLCMYEDCQEFSYGRAEETDTMAGVWANFKQQWSPGTISARLGWK